MSDNMKITEIHYYCDHCEKELTEKRHISICLGTYAGYVEPPKWKHKERLEERPYQFCNIHCLRKFLTDNSICKI